MASTPVHSHRQSHSPIDCSPAFSETLAVEVAPFGVKVLIVAPGAFRTEGIYGQSYVQTQSLPEYDEARELSIKRFKSVPGTEKGDPAKGMEILVDVVRGEGKARGKPWPGYLLLGEDCLNDLNSKAAKLVNIAEDWREISSDVNFDS
ncbi:hypothetical protein CC2G_003342 [Coprinopsis cinerea AmutBmut pab1-1]|nr:hypothetical protein CC2G_003342 [Coprinopsis cinerea AmutBmut pab1-1]